LFTFRAILVLKFFLEIECHWRAPTHHARDPSPG
jgi:hypothetical protein